MALWWHHITGDVLEIAGKEFELIAAVLGICVTVYYLENVQLESTEKKEEKNTTNKKKDKINQNR